MVFIFEVSKHSFNVINWVIRTKDNIQFFFESLFSVITGDAYKKTYCFQFLMAQMDITSM